MRQRLGEHWTARVTPNDGHVDGVHTDVSFVVQNTAPKYFQRSHSTQSCYTGSQLTCSATATDPEDGVLQPLYDWSVNGMPVGVGATWTVSEHASIDWRCDCVYGDGTGFSTAKCFCNCYGNPFQQQSSDIFRSDSCANGPYNDQTCECTANVSDPDEVVTPVYAWTDSSGLIVGRGLGLSHDIRDAGGCTGMYCVSVDSAGGQAQGSDSFGSGNRPPTAPYSVDFSKHPDCNGG